MPGLKAARELAESLSKNKKYITKTVKNKLKTHLIIRNILNKFSDKDYNELIKQMNKQKIKSVLETTNRDQSLKLIIKLLTINPLFLKFLPKLL